MTAQTTTVNRTGSKGTLDRRCNDIAQRVICSLLSRMCAGRLELVLPDGTKRVFGDASLRAVGGAGGSESATITADLQVRDNAFFWRCLLYADIGLAESYMEGLCDSSNISNVISWFLLNNNNSPVLNESAKASPLINLFGFTNRLFHSIRRNSLLNSRKNISEHYDLGNEFFSTFLDCSMTYSSGLFMYPAMDLENAQEAKFHKIARQLRIKATDKILDLGCGWGALSVFLAKTFGCSVTAVTISQEQYDYVKDLIAREGIGNLIDLRLQDYRHLQGKFDKIVSIEMIEAVGDEYMNGFVRKLDELLDRDGLLLMQMITCPDSRYDVLKSNVDFIQKHIFPGSLLPSLYRVSCAMRACGDLFMVDLFDMTPSYVRTLRCWQDNFERNSGVLNTMGFDDRFVRKWRYYFEYCQAAFHMRNISVVQATYSRPNNRTFDGGSREW